MEPDTDDPVDEVATQFGRAMRLLSDLITAPIGLQMLGTLLKRFGLPPAWSTEVERALEGLANGPQGVSAAAVDLLMALPRHRDRGAKVEDDLKAKKQVAAVRRWLDASLPRQRRWLEEDALDVIRHLSGLDRRSDAAGSGRLQGAARVQAVKAVLRLPRYLNHCWKCSASINSRFDQQCADCRRYYRCGNCHACFHEKPGAPTSAEIKRMNPRQGR